MAEERGPRGVEWALLSVLAAMAAVSVLATGAIRPEDFAILEWLMVAALGLAVIRLWAHEQPVFQLSPVLWAVLGFTAYAGFRFVTADIHFYAEEEWTRVLLYAAFFILMTFHVFRPQYSQALLVTLGVVASASSLYAAYQYFAGSNEVWHFVRPENYSRRGSGTFINPNNFAGYMALLLPMLVAWVIAGRIHATMRFVAGYAALMLGVGLVVSASRGGLLAAAGGLLALVFLLVRQKAFRMPALIMLAALLLGGFAVIGQTKLTQWRIAQMQRTELDRDARFLMWQSAEEMWRDHVWLGVGPGHYDAVFPQYRPDLLQRTKPYFAHNDYLNTLADYGLIGALLILGAILAAEFAFRHGWRHLRRDADDMQGARSNRLALLLGAAAGVTAALIHALFDYNFHIPAYALLFVFYLAVMATAWRMDNDRWWWRPRKAGKTVLTGLCVAMALWFGLHAQKRIKETELLTELRQTNYSLPEYPELLRAVVDCDPQNPQSAYELAEYHRACSWEQNSDSKEQGRLALDWYARAAKLNPHAPLVPLRQAMTLTWIGEGALAEPYLKEAERLAPNDYYVLGNIGWCYLQQDKYAAALKYLELSYQRLSYENPVAETYLPLARKLVQAQTPTGR